MIAIDRAIASSSANETPGLVRLVRCARASNERTPVGDRFSEKKKKRKDLFFPSSSLFFPLLPSSSLSALFFFPPSRPLSFGIELGEDFNALGVPPSVVASPGPESRRREFFFLHTHSSSFAVASHAPSSALSCTSVSSRWRNPTRETRETRVGRRAGTQLGIHPSVGIREPHHPFRRARARSDSSRFYDDIIVLISVHGLNLVYTTSTQCDSTPRSRSRLILEY